MHIRYVEAQHAHFDEDELFGERFLLKRPLLRAIEESRDQPRVLLIDEIDRSDEEFEAFLLEILSDFQISVPEIGTIKAVNRPIVILTSNRTRELHDALKRRCIYCWIDYPDFEKELAIVRAKVPGAAAELACQVTSFIQELRTTDLYKVPGVAETIDWTTALVALNQAKLDEAVVRETLGVILKYQDDVHKVQNELFQQVYNRAKRVEQRDGRCTWIRMKTALSCITLLLFGRLLHGLGLEVNPGRMIDVQEALQHIHIGHKHDFFYTLRSFLVKRREDLALFDAAFELFWRKPAGGDWETDLAQLLAAHGSPAAKPEQPLIIAPQPAFRR